MKINGEMHYLRRAVDHEGEVLESYVTKRRDQECPIFCVTGIWFMLIEIGKDDDDDNFQRSAGRVAEGLQAA